MKRIAVILFCLCLCSLSVAAQPPDLTIAYGEAVEGELTNRDFDQLYTFEGGEGDLIDITLTTIGSGDFDPYLYLTTLDNTVLAQNDDSFNRNSRIIARLPEAGTYVIVATRLGERTGYGEGDYRLTLGEINSVTPGTVIEGAVVSGEQPKSHPIIVEESGDYALVYRLVRGDYFPGLTIGELDPESSYTENIAQMNGRGLRGGVMTLSLQADRVYIINLEASYYDYVDDGIRSIYTITVEPIE